MGTKDMTNPPAATMKLNDKGQCPNCLIKPLVYKREPHKFCRRCCRSFDIDSGEQIKNWAWQKVENGFAPTHPSTHRYVTAKAKAR